MKIGFISGKFFPELCGVGDYTLNLAKELQNNNFEVIIYTSISKEYGRGTKNVEVIDKVKILRFKKTWTFGTVWSIFRDIKKEGIDILNFQFSHFAYSKNGINLWIYLLPLLLRVFTKVKIICTVHEPYVPFYNSIKFIILSLWQRFTLFLTCIFSHKIVVTTKRWGKLLRAALIFKQPVHVPVGANIPYKHFLENVKDSIKRELGYGDDDLIILGTFGTLHISKNFRMILDALKELKKNGIKYKFIWIGGILGEEEHKRISEELSMYKLADNVELTGFLREEDVQKYLSILDVFIAPFIDGVSTRRTSVITAMAYGLPVISTQSEHTESVFVHKENIILISNKSSHLELKDAIEKLILDSNLRNKISLSARKTFQKEFAWEAIARRISAVYGE